MLQLNCYKFMLKLKSISILTKLVNDHIKHKEVSLMRYTKINVRIDFLQIRLCALRNGKIHILFCFARDKRTKMQFEKYNQMR